MKNSTFQSFSEHLLLLLKYHELDPAKVKVKLEFEDVTDARKLTDQVTQEFHAVIWSAAGREVDLDEYFRMHGITYSIAAEF